MVSNAINNNEPLDYSSLERGSSPRGSRKEVLDTASDRLKQFEQVLEQESSPRQEDLLAETSNQSHDQVRPGSPHKPEVWTEVPIVPHHQPPPSRSRDQWPSVNMPRPRPHSPGQPQPNPGPHFNGPSFPGFGTGFPGLSASPVGMGTPSFFFFLSVFQLKVQNP